MKCPGQDTRYWKGKDIFEIKCPNCNETIEFFKDDTNRRCTKCNEKFFNPKKDLGCFEYCKYADKCAKLQEEGKLNS